MTTCFCDVVHVKTPHNTIVFTAHALIERRTSSSVESLARKQYSSLMPMEDRQSLTDHAKKAPRLNKKHISHLSPN
jgi:hypothetical protein